MRKNSLLKKASSTVLAVAMAMSMLTGVNVQAETSTEKTTEYAEGFDEFLPMTGAILEDMDSIPEEKKVDEVEEYYAREAEAEIEADGIVSEETAQAQANPESVVDGLPSYVDNSKTKWMPLINSQIGGSCTCYAGVGYQFSYEVNRKMDREATADNAMAPLFIYHLLNSGESIGVNPGYTCEVLKNLGCIENQDFRYGTGKDVSNWDASEKDWANAGNHRLLDYTYLSKDIGLTGYEVTNPKDEDLDVIKAAINDGHILSITTWISGFELKNIYRRKD